MLVFLFFWEGVYAANALIRKNPVSGKSEQRNRDFFKGKSRWLGLGSLVTLLQGI